MLSRPWDRGPTDWYASFQNWQRWAKKDDQAATELFGMLGSGALITLFALCERAIDEAAEAAKKESPDED